MNAYGCVKCQQHHCDKEAIYRKHLGFQSKHGTYRVSEREWAFGRLLVLWRQNAEYSPGRHHGTVDSRAEWPIRAWSGVPERTRTFDLQVRNLTLSCSFAPRGSHRVFTSAMKGSRMTDHPTTEARDEEEDG